MSINKILLLGNLGKDPELRYTPTQVPVCKFSLATSDKRKDAQGNWVEQTEWHNIVVFGKIAESSAQYLKKGRQAFIEGRIQTKKWQDKEGKDRWTTEIIASSVQFIGGARGDAPARTEESVEMSSSNPEEVAAGQALVASLASADSVGSAPAKPAAPAAGIAAGGIEDDDIPF